MPKAIYIAFLHIGGVHFIRHRHELNIGYGVLGLVLAAD